MISKRVAEISIIIPFLNEAENAPVLSKELSAFAAANSALDLEIVFVNDGSTDNSLEVFRSLPFPKGTKMISLSQNYGSHAALRAGILNSSGKYVTFMYADLQDPLSLVLDMHKKITEPGYDIVWSVREETQNSSSETFFSRTYAKLMQKYVSNKFPDKGFDVLMFNGKIREQLNINPESNSSIFLQILTMGFGQTFVTYKKQPRLQGKSKWTFAKKVKMLVDSFVAFSYAPIRFVTYMGAVFFVVGIAWTIYFIARKILVNDMQSGWPMLMSILLIGFGITNISLGIIAEYLWRTLDASRKRPVYIIDKIEQL